MLRVISVRFGPVLEWAGSECGVVVTALARHFRAQKIGVFETFIGVQQFYLGHNKTFVVAKELVDLERMLTGRNEPAHLIDDAGLAKAQQRKSFVDRDFFFKLVARKSVIGRRAFDG